MSHVLRFSKNIIKNERLMMFMFISTLGLYFIFAPAINLLYYAGDAYRYSFGGSHQACSADDGFFFMKTLGRPIQAYLDCFSFKFGYNLEKMRLIRLGTVVLMGMGTGLFADFLFTLGLPFISCLCIAGSMFVMQRFSDDSVTTAAASLPVAIILVMLASKALNQASANTVFKYSPYRTRDIVWMTLSGALIFCAMLSYPAMGFFFVVLSLSRLLFTDLANWSTTRRQLLREVILFCVVCVLFFIYGYLNMRFNQQAPVPDQYHLDRPNMNPLELIKRILTLGDLKNPVWKLFYWSNVSVQTRMALIILASGIAASLFRFVRSSFYQENKPKALFVLMQAIFGTICLLLLSDAFYLLIPDLSILELRFLFTILASGLIVIFWSVIQVSYLFNKKLVPVVLNIILGAAFIMLASTQSKYLMVRSLSFAQYYQSNQALVSDYLAKGHQLRRIHFVIDHSIYPYNKFFLTNAIFRELNGVSNDNLKWCSLARGVPGAEVDHQKELMDCIAHLPKNGIAVTYSYKGDPYTLSPDTLLVDNGDVTVSGYFNHFYREYFDEKMALPF